MLFHTFNVCSSRQKARCVWPMHIYCACTFSLLSLMQSAPCASCCPHMTRRIICPVPAQIFTTVVLDPCRGSTACRCGSTEVLLGPNDCSKVLARPHKQVETSRHVFFDRTSSADVSARVCDRVCVIVLCVHRSVCVLLPFVTHVGQSSVWVL